MKTLAPAILLFFGLWLLSCEYDSTITVRNEVSNVTIQQITFSNRVLSHGALLPGQEAKARFSDTEDNWPKISNISFIMQANNNEVFLVTDSIYVLEKDKGLEVVIDDNTPVSSF